MSKTMNVARVVGGVVVNIEVADEEWISANTTDSISFIPTNGAEVNTGMLWNPENGFSPAPLVPPSQESLDWAAANGDTSWIDLNK